MRDKPFGAALLEVAHQALMREIVPTLTGRERYVALMVANAVGIAAREFEQEAAAARAWDRALARVEPDGGDLDTSAGRLVAAIRSGAHDADPALHGALLETAAVAAGIWKPTLDAGRDGRDRDSSVAP